jgi:hypothetical protein
LESFPLKKSGNSHTKTCPTCYKRNNIKNAKATQRRKEEWVTTPSAHSSGVIKHHGLGRISSGNQKFVSWDELKSELLNLDASLISLDRHVNILSLGLMGT